MIGSRERAAATIAVLLRQELEEKIVMTHSASATAREALLHAGPGRVVCTVSEPVGRGPRCSPPSWRRLGSPPRSSPTRTPSTRSPRSSILLLGADTVFRDGSLLNKVGTHPLAKAASRRGVPVVVASEVLKVAPADPHQPDEERVDLTPAKWITRYVTEEGVFAPDEIAALIDRTPVPGGGVRAPAGLGAAPRRAASTREGPHALSPTRGGRGSSLEPDDGGSPPRRRRASAPSTASFASAALERRWAPARGRGSGRRRPGHRVGVAHEVLEADLRRLSNSAGPGR